ncbi:MAG TPA: ATP-binding protein [Chitinophagales bacterium]|nr:ATP-binding protein [Chitinophagales bacterium]
MKETYTRMALTDIDYRLLFQSVPGLNLILSPEFTIIDATNAYLHATLTRREEISGKNIFEVFTDDPNDPAANGVENLRNSLLTVLRTKKQDIMAVQKYSVQLPESQGGGFEERYWSPINRPVLDNNNEVRYIIHRVEDVSEFIKLKESDARQGRLAEDLKTRSQQMENEIYNHAWQLRLANLQLQEAERVKDEFFANVSHELRTPLSLILAPLESLLSEKNGQSPTQQKQLLQTIHNNAVRLLQMVNGLLDFAKFEAGQLKAEANATDVTALLNSVATDFAPMLKSKQLHLQLEIMQPVPLLMLDQYLLERILFNLVSNAVKFTPANGKINISVEWHNTTLILKVRDTGIGIAPDDLKNLFKKFRQVEGSSTRRYEGTGLGLAMVKEFSELMGGGVAAESMPGKGSLFTVEVAAPLAQNAVAAPQAGHTVLSMQYTGIEPRAAEILPAYARLKQKILICEDNTQMGLYIESLLSQFGEVRLAADGEEGLALATAWQPDIILTDVMMPKMDGIELCSAIKNNPATTGITVVLLTALTYRDAMVRGWEARADEYLFKPFHPEELVTRIRSLLAIKAERKKASEELERKNAALTVSNAELESFSYSVSHDLRAPLRAIYGYTKIILDDYAENLETDARDMMKKVLDNAEKMGQLIEDLLAFSRAGRKQITRNPLSMDDLARKTLMEMKEQIKINNATIAINNMPPAHADYNLIAQVYTNLLSNALKYSRNNDNPVIELGAIEKDGRPVYYVKDNGVGFDMRYYDKLFGVFQRLHSTTEFEGTGVGLALVQRIISKHGGSIWAESALGQGATFYFTIGENDSPEETN